MGTVVATKSTDRLLTHHFICTEFSLGRSIVHSILKFLLGLKIPPNFVVKIISYTSIITTVEFKNGSINSRIRRKVTLVSHSKVMLASVSVLLVQGGESTRQEMCQNLLYYYPKTSLTSCGSFPDPEIAFRPFLKRHL